MEEALGTPGWVEWMGSGMGGPSLLEGPRSSMGRSLFSERKLFHGGKTLDFSNLHSVRDEEGLAPVLFVGLSYLSILPKVPRLSTRLSNDPPHPQDIN